MENLFKALVLGVVEGVTEFLPISSTGHLILVNQFLDFSDKSFSNMFNVVIQLGAILSVVVLFHKKLIPLSPHQTPEEKKAIFALWGKTLLGVIPALVLGFLFADLIDQYLFNPLTVASALILWGAALILVEKWVKPAPERRVEDLTWYQAFIVGLIQCLAMIPGTSRSAATILGGMLLGAPRKTAAEFSFFLAIPTMAAASGYSLLKFFLNNTAKIEVSDGVQGLWILTLAVGFITSFVVALLVIKALMQLLSKHSFKAFGWYRILVGAVVLLFYVFGGLQGI